MLNLEQIVVDLLNPISGIEVNAGSSQRVAGKDTVCVTQNNNAHFKAANSDRDRLISVGVKIESFCSTPERRNELDSLIDDAMSAICLSCSGANHLEKIEPDQTVTFRSVMQYSGKYDTKLNQFYMK